MPRSMIVAIEQMTWNQLHWLKLLHASYIFLLRQAGKAGVFYSADRCFKTGTDPRNVFDKQIVKVWTPCLSAFYCVTLAWLWRGVWKLAPSRDFRNQRARGQKTIGSHLKVIPLKLFYYQTFFETFMIWTFKKCNKKGGHLACLHISGLLKWGIFTGCA